MKGSCGICEYREACGGCRARAYAATGDYLMEDAWCTHNPSKQAVSLDAEGGESSIPWSEEAKERMEKVPPFIRGAVVKLVERYAVENGYSEVTPEVMAEARKKFWKQ